MSGVPSEPSDTTPPDLGKRPRDKLHKNTDEKPTASNNLLYFPSIKKYTVVIPVRIFGRKNFYTFIHVRLIFIMVMNHGTNACYKICRCVVCTDAHAQAQREWVEKAKLKEPPVDKHGTWYAYTKYACRCAKCKEAGRRYFRARRIKKSAGLEDNK